MCTVVLFYLFIFDGDFQGLYPIPQHFFKLVYLLLLCRTIAATACDDCLIEMQERSQRQ